MGTGQSIYLGVLGGVLVIAIGFAYTGVKRLRAMGDRVPPQKRLVVYLASTGSALLILATSFTLMATLRGETRNWDLFHSSLATAVICTFVAGMVARLSSNPSSY